MSVLKSQLEVSEIIKKITGFKWKKFGEWGAPVLYKDIYCTGLLKNHVRKYIGMDLGCGNFLHIKPITYIEHQEYEKFARPVRNQILQDSDFLEELTTAFYRNM